MHEREGIIRVGLSSERQAALQRHYEQGPPPDWAADPFRSQAWRLAFQSLAWTWAAAESPERGVRERAVAAALSWSRANPWGQPADTLSPRS